MRLGSSLGDRMAAFQEALDGTCHEDECDEEPTKPVLWPGEGVLGYCDDHGEKAMSVLATMGYR